MRERARTAPLMLQHVDLQIRERLISVTTLWSKESNKIRRNHEIHLPWIL